MNRIRDLRKANGYTQSKLANMLNITQANLSGWENGKWEPDSNALSQLAEIFNVSVDCILGRTDEITSTEPIQKDIVNTVSKAKELKNILFGARIKALRESRYLSQDEFALAFNVSVNDVRRWEEENVVPPLDTLMTIADVYSVSLDYLLCRSEFLYYKDQPDVPTELVEMMSKYDLTPNKFKMLTPDQRATMLSITKNVLDGLLEKK